MKRTLSFVMACASVMALSPSVQAKPDKDKGDGGGGQAVQARGGGGGSLSVSNRPQLRSGGGGNIARVQPNRPALQTQRYYSPQVTRSQIQRTSPSVALTGRPRTDAGTSTYNQRLQQLRTQQQLAQRRENLDGRRDRWQDRHGDWSDRHDRDRDWHVPFEVHRSWDHNHIHVWNNHRYRWYNNAWVIIDPGFGYGYDYGDYYYDYAPDVLYSPSDIGGGSLAARVQLELAREGYDPGPADGVIGPQTRDAIIDFQRDNGLPVTGRIDTPLLRELGL